MRLYFGLYFFAVIASTSFSQPNYSYVPLPESNTKWTVDKGAPAGYYVYSVKGDSTYNGFVYKKYYKVSDTTSFPVSAQYFAMVRQDIASKKVFGIKNGTTSEKLLYNFNLNINDTVTVFCFEDNYNAGGPLNVKAVSCDSVLIAGQYRRRLGMEGYYPSMLVKEYWIEGIGSDYGLFSSGVVKVVITDVCFTMLLCCIKNGILEYKNPNCGFCVQTISCIDNIAEHENNVLKEFFPNPADGLLHLKYEMGHFTAMEIKNTISQTIQKINLNTYDTQSSLNISSLSPGIYFLTLSGEQKITKKFIVAR